MRLRDLWRYMHMLWFQNINKGDQTFIFRRDFLVYISILLIHHFLLHVNYQHSLVLYPWPSSPSCSFLALITLTFASNVSQVRAQVQSNQQESLNCCIPCLKDMNLQPKLAYSCIMRCFLPKFHEYTTCKHLIPKSNEWHWCECVRGSCHERITCREIVHVHERTK